MSEPSSDPTPTSPGKTDSAGYVVVARRYRPRDFDELVGQQHVGQALRNAIETNRVGHAYLFTGARGVGKTSTARIFAKALNCPGGPNSHPDQSSDISKAIDSGEDVDVIEIDGASNRGIDEIRSLRANVGVRPSRSRFKIYIIDEVHMLTTPAFNALLKTLEEPPEHVKFIFCTTDPEKIPITVLSRCQRFDFAPVELQEIVARLRFIVDSEQAEADETALQLIARRAAGSMRDSQSLLEQVLSFSSGKLTADNVHSMLGTANDERLHEIAHALADRDAALSLKLMDAAIDEGVDAGKLAEQLLGYFRDLMAVTVGCDASMLRHASASMHASLSDLGNQWGLQTVLAVVGLIDQTLVRTRHSVHARVLLEATLIQICHLPDLQQIANLALAASGQLRGPAKENRPAVEKKKTNLNLGNVNTQPSNPNRVATEPIGIQQGISKQETSNQLTCNSTATEPSNHPTGETSATFSQGTNTAPSRDHQTSPSEPLAARTTGSLTLKTTTGITHSNAEFQRIAIESTASQQTPTSSDTETVTANTADRIEWTASNAQTVWRAAMSHLESMTESLARMVERFEFIGANSAKAELPHDSNLAKRRLESPESREAITRALREVTGQHITFEVTLSPHSQNRLEQKPQSNKPSRAQRMREIENNQLVKDCLKLFEAEIVNVDSPR